ncbi:MAG: sodium:solute symporter family protein [Bacteroidota bacterium]
MELNLQPLDVAIIIGYVILTIFIGFYISKRASRSTESYFLGGNEIPWYYLGLSNASGMFDVSGTMWMVTLMFIFGLKSVFIPWLWPVFNQIILMVFLSVWLRRSGVMTGAEWVRFRFGTSAGANYSNIIVVIFAVLVVITNIALGFVGLGKFAATFFPFELAADPYWNEIYYGFLLTLATTAYVIKGGMYSVVFTEVLQYVIMTIASIVVGIIAMNAVSPDLLAQFVPAGWDQISFSWRLDLDWENYLASANTYITNESYELFGFFVLMIFARGLLSSMAGPAPTYDMQRVLSTQTPRDAAKMSGFVNVVLLFPRYMFITGIAILALVFFSDFINAEAATAEAAGEIYNFDFERLLPLAINSYIPTGLMGLLIAGLLAAFMSTFAAAVNAAPAYLVNDIYRRYVDNSRQEKFYVKLSYLASIAVVVVGTISGLMASSLNSLIDWLVGGLYGGYIAANVLKWYWWRFNAYGYFAGMLAGMVMALILPVLLPDWAAWEAFPFNLGVSFLVAVVVSLNTPADDRETLKRFYYKTRPWGIWGPIRKELQAAYPELEANRNFARDMINVLIGIIWQTAITAAPIFLVIQQFTPFLIALLIIAICSLILKYNWYDKVEDYPADYDPSVVPAPPREEY